MTPPRFDPRKTTLWQYRKKRFFSHDNESDDSNDHFDTEDLSTNITYRKSIVMINMAKTTVMSALRSEFDNNEVYKK